MTPAPPASTPGPGRRTGATAPARRPGRPPAPQTSGTHRARHPADTPPHHDGAPTTTGPATPSPAPVTGPAPRTDGGAFGVEPAWVVAGGRVVGSRPGSESRS